MSLHWADEAAQRLVRAKPDKSPLVVAAGITPSGVVHIGNLREVMTSGMVAQALRDLGKQVRFFFSWDDFDVFRKVPADVPEAFAQHLRCSISRIPDPWGTADSYAGHFIQQFERELSLLGLQPEFIRQSARYRAGTYAAGIARVLEKRAEIRRILDSFRSEQLSDDWLPLSGYCRACERDDLSFAIDASGVRYTCRSCGAAHAVAPDWKDDMKLPWRIDWPMRWAFEAVDFEPGGKDHSSAGGSFDTACVIAKEIFDQVPPQYLAYEFVLAKGETRKLSSSAGNAITVSDCLDVYPPEILRWIYSRYLPSAAIKVAFDDDVIQVYEEFDRAVRAARQGDKHRRAIELAMIPSRPSLLVPEYELPPFRQVTTVLQALDMDADRTLAYFGGDDGGPRALWLRERIACAGSWIALHAGPDFVYRVRATPIVRPIDERAVDPIRRLMRCLEQRPDETGIISLLRELSKADGFQPDPFYSTLYDLVIGRPKGPKLSTVLTSIGPDRALALIAPSLDRSRSEAG